MCCKGPGSHGLPEGGRAQGQQIWSPGCVASESPCDQAAPWLFRLPAAANSVPPPTSVTKSSVWEGGGRLHR